MILPRCHTTHNEYVFVTFGRTDILFFFTKANRSIWKRAFAVAERHHFNKSKIKTDDDLYK